MVTGLEALGLRFRPSQWLRNLMACREIKFCKLSFIETRFRTQTLVPELERRLQDINSTLEVPSTVDISDCPASCVRIQIADICFKDLMVDDGLGGSVKSVQVHLGGSLGLHSSFSHKLRQNKITSDKLSNYIDRVIRNFVKHHGDSERFAQCVIRAEEDDL